MKIFTRFTVFSVILFVFIIGISSQLNMGCSTINAISNIQRLQFKLGSINNFSLAGINLTNKNSIGDFSVTDILSLTEGFANNNLPAKFTLNVLARNPNTPGGSQNTTSAVTRMDWKLLVDNKQTISGIMDSKIIVPGTGQTATIPINMTLNLMDFFNSLGYEGVVKLALALGGVSGSPARVTLKAIPAMEVFGIFFSGDEVTIVDKQFN
ncbi:MAG: hypothetical protein KDC42_03500 [Ignavibacteriae bacterium]|nr:hypothetical protein [Ignavibacteriota bacterium]